MVFTRKGGIFIRRVSFDILTIRCCFLKVHPYGFTEIPGLESDPPGKEPIQGSAAGGDVVVKRFC